MRPSRSSAWRPWLAAAAVLVAVSAATATQFENGFVLDDPFVIVRSNIIHEPSQLPQVFRHGTMYVSSASSPDLDNPIDTYRPVTLVSFFWDAALSGRSPWAYHLTNMFLHALCVLLLFRLAWVLLGPEGWPYAALGALWFGLQPWLAEAHVWIDGRSDPMALAFGLGALLVAVRPPSENRARTRWLRSTVVFALFLAGLMSKEVLVGVLPALLLWPSIDEPLRERARRLTPFVAATVVYLVVRTMVLGGMRASAGTGTLVLALERLPLVWLDGLRALLVPSPPYLRSLRDEYASLPSYAPAIAWGTAIAIGAVVALYRKRAPALPWIGLWYAGALAPVAIIATVLWPGFGRYLYVPAAALGVGAALVARFAWVRVRPRIRRWLVVGAVAYLGLEAALLAGTTRDYRSDETLYAAAIRQRPDLAYGWGFLGLALSDDGQHVAAIHALRRAVAIDPHENRYLARLGHELATIGDRQGAAEIASLGLREFKGRPEAATYHLMVVRSLMHRDPHAAVFHLLECLRLRPGRPDCARALKLLLEHAPDRDENCSALRELVRDPRYQRIHAEWRNEIDACARRAGDASPLQSKDAPW